MKNKTVKLVTCAVLALASAQSFASDTSSKAPKSPANNTHNEAPSSLPSDKGSAKHGLFGTATTVDGAKKYASSECYRGVNVLVINSSHRTLWLDIDNAGYSIALGPIGSINNIYYVCSESAEDLEYNDVTLDIYYDKYHDDLVMPRMHLGNMRTVEIMDGEFYVSASAMKREPKVKVIQKTGF